MGERLLDVQKVTGSSPVTPTIPGLVVQLVRTLACHARGRGFESLPDRHNFEKERIESILSFAFEKNISRAQS